MSLSKSRTRGSAEQTRESSIVSPKNGKSSKNGKPKKKNVPAYAESEHADEETDVVPGRNGSKKISGSKKSNRKAIDQELIGLLDHKELLKVLMEVKNGNFSVRMPFDKIGDHCIEGFHTGSPNTFCIGNFNPFSQFTLLTNGITGAGEFHHHFFVERNYLV